MIAKIEGFHKKFNWSITQGFKSTFKYKGRATRWEFFAFNIFLNVLIILSEKLDSFFLPDNNWEPISSVAMVVLLIPTITVGVRRLHDAEFSGWWILVGLVPFFLYPVVGPVILLGLIPYLVLVLKKGTPGENRFGHPVNMPIQNDARLADQA